MLLFSFFIVSPTQFNQAQYEENKIEQSLVTKTDFRWLGVYGWKRYENASMDVKPFLPFQGTEKEFIKNAYLV